MTLVPKPPDSFPPPPSGAADPGTVLRRQMREVGLSQAAFGHAIKKSQGWISQYLFGNTEATIKRLWATDPYTLTQIAKALEWSDAELLDAVGVSVLVQQPAALSTDTTFLNRWGDPASLTVEIPVYGEIAAGVKGFRAKSSPDDCRTYDRKELGKGADETKFFIVTANGNSMFEENMPRPVPNGSVLLVEANALPDDGDLVIAYIPELEIGVVKQFKRTDSDVLLKSYRMGGPVFWASQYPDMKIEGVVRRVSYSPKS